MMNVWYVLNFACVICPLYEVLITFRAILHDESVFKDQLSFNPDRFLKDGQVDPDVRDPMDVIFGSGRRMCPGKYLAYQSIWITIASTLAMFNIEKAKDKMGVPITPKEDYHYGTIW